jgi:ribosomal protein L32
MEDHRQERGHLELPDRETESVAGAPIKHRVCPSCGRHTVRQEDRSEAKEAPIYPAKPGRNEK